MEDSNNAKEILKKIMKPSLKGIVDNSLEEHSAGLVKLIQKATDNVVNKTLDEAKIEEIADAARKGAAYTVVSALIKQTAEDAIKKAMPILNQISEEFNKIVAEAALEAIMELIEERLRN